MRPKRINLKRNLHKLNDLSSSRSKTNMIEAKPRPENKKEMRKIFKEGFIIQNWEEKTDFAGMFAQYKHFQGPWLDVDLQFVKGIQIGVVSTIPIAISSVTANFRFAKKYSSRKTEFCCHKDTAKKQYRLREYYAQP